MATPNPQSVGARVDDAGLGGPLDSAGERDTYTIAATPGPTPGENKPRPYYAYASPGKTRP